MLREFGWCDSYVTYTASELRSVRSLWGVLRRVRQARPSLAVHLGSDKNSWLRIWRDRLFFRLGGARRTIACPSNKVTAWGGLRRDRRIYPLEVDRLLAGMQRYGIQRPGTLFGLPIGNDQAGRVAAVLEASGLDRGRPLVGMCPGSKQQAKRWPVERYGELGRRLIEEAGANVAIVGGPDEAQIGAVLGRAWPPGRWVNAAGKLTVLESAALLRGCLFYVGNDTGAMHLAAAVGTRCVAVFSAREPARSWEPYGENHIVLRRDVPCQNCYLSTCGVEQLRCLTGIPVDDVWAACRRMLVYR